MKMVTPKLRASVLVMRVLCPLGIIGAVVVGTFDYVHGSISGVVVCAYCGGVNTVLTWLQWELFEL